MRSVGRPDEIQAGSDDRCPPGDRGASLRRDTCPYADRHAGHSPTAQLPSNRAGRQAWCGLTVRLGKIQRYDLAGGGITQTHHCI